MGQANSWIMDIIAPAILLIALIWLVMRRRSSRDMREDRRSEEGTRELYRDEEQRRREGTDKL